MQASALPAGAALPFAGFWARAAACLIDLPVGLVLGWIARLLPFLVWEGLLEGKVRRVLFDDDDAMITFFGAVGGVLLGWFYYAGMESSRKRGTLGKLAVGLEVADLRGGRISFGRATGRYFGKFLSAITLGVGFLVAAFSERRQALHDSMAGCLVLRREGMALDTAGAEPGRGSGRGDPAAGPEGGLSKRLAVMSLVLGLASIPLPYVGLFLGAAGIACARLQRPRRGDVLSLTGLGLSIVGTVVWGAATLLFLFMAATR